MPVILPPVLPEVPAIIRTAAHSPRLTAPHPRPNNLQVPPQIVGPVTPAPLPRPNNLQEPPLIVGPVTPAPHLRPNNEQQPPLIVGPITPVAPPAASGDYRPRGGS